MASVRFDGVNKTYPNGHPALVDFALDLADGELLVVVGPSGCGKSTLLRLLAGLEQASSGDILIDGRRANTLSPQERNIAMVFQDYALYPNMTVRGNLEFPLKMRKLGKAEIQGRVAEVAAMLNIVDLLDRHPRQLSGGQRQRVAMGRALVREPSVFLLDEPLSNLDAKLRVQVRAEIGDLQRRLGATMVYVTHDQVEAMTLGQRIAVLNQGRLQQVASPSELYRHPANTFVASFIGSPPMNLIATRLVSNADGGWSLPLGGQLLPLPWVENSAATVATIGLRAEALRPSTAEAGGLLVEAAWVEYLGHETLLYFRPMGQTAEGDPLVARLSGMAVFRPGEVLRLEIEAEGVFLFDEEGRLLVPNGQDHLP